MPGVLGSRAVSRDLTSELREKNIICLYFLRCNLFTDLRRVRLFLFDLRLRDLRPPENVVVLPPLTTK